MMKRKRKEKIISIHSQKKIKVLTKYEKLLIGASLYWAEGAKQKRGNISARVSISNSDPDMIKIFMNWLDIICNREPRSLIYELYIHESADSKKAVSFWANTLKIRSKSIKIRFKRHKIRSNRTNVKDEYHGLIKVSARKSTDLNRKIRAWTTGIIRKWGVV